MTPELESFDWLNFKSEAPKEQFVPEIISIAQAPSNESPYDRKLRMLLQLSRACTACSMCELGLKCAERDGVLRDPHIFSNLNPRRFMIVGQNPGWNELKAGEPFVGEAGMNFDNEVKKHGLSRNDFYVCNAVRCYTSGNSRPTQKNIDRCKPFLQMEINLIKPKLVIALGGVAFSQLCPRAVFGESLKKLTPSEFGVKVFAIYHPSPVNLRDHRRREAFEDQIKIMCGLIKALKNEAEANS